MVEGGTTLVTVVVVPGTVTVVVAPGRVEVDVTVLVWSSVDVTVFVSVTV